MYSHIRQLFRKKTGGDYYISVRVLLCLAISILIAMSLSFCFAAPLPPINMTRDGIAIKGYDPVAYFTDGKALKGERNYEYNWNGAIWIFAKQEHMDLFRNDPEKYAPRYGGYCAYAVSQGTTADIDPYAWNIVEGKLYLNLNEEVQGLWLQDIKGYIQKADKNWPAVLQKK